MNKHFHLEWSFKYTIRPGGTDVQHLEKIDLDCLADRDRIKIWGRSVRAFVQHKTDIISVHMYLPQQVDRIIIFQFGDTQPICYAENVDGLKVYSGKIQKYYCKFAEI